MVLAEPSFEEGASVDAGRGVSLDEHLVAAAGVLLAAEEVIEAHLVQRCCAGVGGDVAADADVRSVGPADHDRCVPADARAYSSLEVLVAGELRLVLRGDGVDEIRAAQRGDAQLRFG